MVFRHNTRPSTCFKTQILLKRVPLEQNLLTGSSAMSRVCQVTGKRPMVGNNVSHSKRRTRKRFLPNLHWHRFWVQSENRFVRILVSSKGLRVIDKVGIENVVVDLRSRGEKV